MATHQSNHATLLRLRHTSDALSEQITQVLTLLANTRAEVLSTPATTFTKESRDVPYDDLLTYAKKISKFTVPPTFRSSVPQVQPTSPQEDEQKQQQQQQQGDDQAQDEPRAEVITPGEAEERGVVMASLPAAVEEAPQKLGPTVGNVFIPWPADDTIRRGALARIQGMLDVGEDPAMAAGVMEERDKSGSREERKVLGQKERIQASTSMPVDVEMTERRELAPAEEKPAVFGGLDLYDPDED